MLHGISLTVPQGSLTALVGESGSGKSTLAKLLVHYYDVTGGSIHAGRAGPAGDERGGSQRPDFLCVPGAVPVQHEPVGEYPPGKTGRHRRGSAGRGGKGPVHGEFLARLDQGIHTMAGDGGKELSGGERQRISLARAILKDAPIVVLDEATAFMDPENEEKMNAAIAEVIRGKTVIVIAHRLHSIVNADQICVLDQGNVAGMGRHEDIAGKLPGI